MSVAGRLCSRWPRASALQISIRHGVRRAKMGAARASNAVLPYGLWDFVFQMGVLSSCYWLYTFTRAAVQGKEAVALHNAAVVMRIEQALHIFHEPWLQAQVSHSETLLRGLDWFWSNVHLPMVLGCLLWVYLARHRSFGFVRNWFLTLNLLGIAVYALLPTAPPRMVPTSGIVDTAWVLSPHSLQWGITSAVANPYAAMPSLHMAYALFVACTVILLSRRTWMKLLFGLYPVAIGVAVIATGNHWFLDALAGALVTATAYVACSRASEQTLLSRQPVAAVLRLPDKL
jgi:membrane-associated phospholipid phosphatase